MRTCNAYHTQHFMEKIVNSLEENPHRKNIMKVWKSYSTEDVITVIEGKKKKSKVKKLEHICYLAGNILRFGEGNGTPLQYSCLENPIDGGGWKAAVHGVVEGWT